jgi:hypothetical protein
MHIWDANEKKADAKEVQLRVIRPIPNHHDDLIHVLHLGKLLFIYIYGTNKINFFLG